MRQFHPLKVSAIQRETPDCVSVAFSVPPALASTFAFTQGQYLTLRTVLDGQEVRRSYSLCTSPFDGELRVAIKWVPDGKFSTYANHTLQVGDTLDVMPPDGRFFTPVDAANEHHYVAFAAGSGITPIMSIMKTLLQAEPQSHFTLFYGNQNKKNIIFREAIEALKNTYVRRLSVHYLLSREHTGSALFNGRIDGDKCRAYSGRLFAPTEVSAFFLCGPEDMTIAVRDALLEQGVERKNIHLELFGSQTARGTRKTTQQAATEYKADVQLQLDGNIFSFTITDPAESILDAALRHGADLPYACKGGVCCTCKAKIESGQVSLEVNYGLEPDEVAAGYTLTCQAHPVSDTVVINFDA